MGQTTFEKRYAACSAAFSRIGMRCLSATQQHRITRAEKPTHSLPRTHRETKQMPKYVIEREIPGAGQLTAEQLSGIANKSCDVLKQLGTEVQWVHSYITGDKVYCVYIAPNEDLIREHAQRGEFPANRISEVASIIDPTTAT